MTQHTLVPGNITTRRFTRGLVLVMSVLAWTFIFFLWWSLFNLPTDQVGGVMSAQGLVVTHLNVSADANPIQPQDILIRIRGRGLEEWLTFDAARSLALLRDTHAGQMVAYTAQRGDKLITTTQPLIYVPALDGLQRIVFVLPITLAFLGIATFITWRRPDDPAARLIAVCFLAVTLNTVDDSVNEANMTWLLAFLPFIQLLEVLTFWLVGSAATHFSLVFPHCHPWLQRHPWLAWAVHLVNPVVSTGVALATGGPLLWQLMTGPAEKTRYAIGILLWVWTVANLAYQFQSVRNPIERAQLRWLALGMAFSVGPWVFGFVIPLVFGGTRLGITQTAILWLLMPLLPLSMAFAILRYRLLDIDTVINRSLVYTTLSIVLAGVYLTLVSSLSQAFRLLSGQSNDATATFLSTLGVALAFAPARTRIQALIDRLFYRQRPNLPALSAELSKTLATTLDIHTITRLLIETVPTQLGLECAGVWLCDEAARRFTTPEGQALVEDEAACQLLEALPASGAPTFVNPPDAPPQPVMAPLRTHRMEVVMLLSVRAARVGMYAVGVKRSGQWYHRAEIEFLETLGYQAAIALENGLLIQKLAQQERLKREMEIARTIQTSLLPKEHPNWAGLDVYGLSLPANEVGGDFYSYLTLNSGGFAIAVGDVSGKGVPGALFMAVALGVIRAQAPDSQHTDHFLRALNVSLYEQMAQTHMNVALLYTILAPSDGQRWQLHASNAGLIAPLLLVHNDTCNYLDACGLPLGATSQSVYNQVDITLQPGDVLLLCSDGIVEARNAAGQLFGFNRLQEALSGLQDYRAQDIAQHLIEAARQFSGSAEFEDDATLVVVSVKGKPEQQQDSRAESTINTVSDKEQALC